MVLHLVQNNYPERPVHFAVTVGDDNTMGLSKYTIMEGMVYTLVEEPLNKSIDVEKTAFLVDSVYQFRGLGDPKVYIDMNTEGLLTNYSATNFRLVMWAQEQLQDIDKALTEAKADTSAAAKPLLDSLTAVRKDKIAFAEKYLDLNARLLPREWRTHYYSSQLYQAAGEIAKAEVELLKGMEKASDPRVFAMSLAQVYTDRQDFDKAEKLLYALLEKAPGDFEAAYSLAEIHQRQGELSQSRDVLATWLRHNPSHQFAAVIDNQLKSLEARIRSGGVESPSPAPSPETTNSNEGSAPPTPPALGPEGVPGLAPAADS
jgi:thioredoxin-like negative regulator of GroEL